MAYKVGDLIYLEWEDAVASGGGWHSQEDAAKWFKETSMTVKEVGWVHSKTKKYIAMFSRESCWGPGDNDIGLLQKIPLTWIRKLEVLKKGGGKNEKKKS